MLRLVVLLFVLTLQVQVASAQALRDFYCDLNYNCPTNHACEDQMFHIDVKDSKVVAVEGNGYFDYFKEEKFAVKNGVLHIWGLYEGKPFRAQVTLSKVASRVTPGFVRLPGEGKLPLRCNFID